MIHIDRTGAHAPRALLRDGKAHLESTIAPRAKSGQLRSDDFDRTIYASDEVRERLWKMQHYKCCFCEREYEIKHATVEHFRPKTEASDDTRNRGHKRPGYWWLAYELGNLYFCCRNCNTPKATFFPLDPGASPLTPRTLPTQVPEQAQLLDPGGTDDPEAHIQWRWMGRRRGYVPVGSTIRGRQTVRASELDVRDTLCRLRAKFYDRRVRPILEDFQNAKARGDHAEMAQVRTRARKLAQPQEQFAAMTRWILRRKGVL